MSDSKIEKTEDLRNFEHKEHIEVDSTGWHLKPDAPEKVKKQFRKYMKHIDKGKKDIYFGKIMIVKNVFLVIGTKLKKLEK